MNLQVFPFVQYYKPRMAKKVNQKNTDNPRRRTKSIQRCLADAEDFLRNQHKQKKIVKTKTMLKTIEEGKKILAIKKKTASKIPSPKHSPKKIKRKTAASKAKKISRAVVQPPRSLPLTTGPTIIRAKSIDNSIKPTKATIFKTASKQDLPLPAFGFIDICFCIDSTGSMGGELAQVQSTIVAIIERIQNKVRTQGVTLRFAVVAYRDHGDSSVVEHQDFTDAADTIDYVKKLTAYGGGDEPEAAHDGLLDACKNLNWIQVPGTPMLRYIFHVLDAPPHGREFTQYEGRQGCTCGKTTDQVVHEINLRQIHYRMIKVRSNPRVDKTEQILKERLVNFDSADIGHASEMDIRVSEMIIHEIMPPA